MQVSPRLFAREFFLIATFWLALPIAIQGTGMMETGIDALFNLRDQHQANVMKSVHGVAEAMREGGPRGEEAGESTLHYLERKQHEYHELAVMNKNLLHEQRALEKIDLQILTKLPPGDPRRHELTAEIKNLNHQAASTRESEVKFATKYREFSAELQRYHQRHGQ